MGLLFSMGVALSGVVALSLPSALYRVQVPGARSLPPEATYGLRDMTGLQYWNSALLVRHGDASGAEALLVFRPSASPAGEYGGCVVLSPGESGDALCP